ncbi:GNAT family N-acetyltransferase [Thomasclavelia sp.]
MNIKLEMINKHDYEQMMKLISEVWDFSDYFPNIKAKTAMCKFYLYSSLLGATFGQKAVADGKTVGFLIGKSKKGNKLYYSVPLLIKMLRQFLIIMLYSDFTSKKKLSDMITISRFYTISMKKEQINTKGNIELFVTGKEFQGLGIGKKLLNAYDNYMIENECLIYYVQTDSNCNYGFYEYHNFEKIVSGTINLKNKAEIVLYLYLREVLK